MVVRDSMVTVDNDGFDDLHVHHESAINFERNCAMVSCYYSLPSCCSIYKQNDTIWVFKLIQGIVMIMMAAGLIA